MLGSYYEEMSPVVDPKPWCSTGLWSLDLMCGRGLPDGTFTQIFGPSQSRKTTLCLFLLAAAQRQGYTTAWLNKERSFPEMLALLAQVDFRPPELKLPKGKYGYFGGRKNLRSQAVIEPGLLFERRGPDTIERTFRDVRRFVWACKRGGHRPFIVIDSLSVLTTDLEEEKGEMGQTRMTHAKERRKCMRLISGDLEKAGGHLIFIDHEKPTGISGGSANDFFPTTRLRLTFETEVKDERENTRAVAIKASTRHPGKSRQAAPNDTILLIDYERGVDKPTDFLWAANHIGLLDRNGSWYSLLGGFPGETNKWHGRSKARLFYHEHITEHLDWFERHLDAYYLRRWHRWCEHAGIEPREHLRTFGGGCEARVDDVIERVKAAGIDPWADLQGTPDKGERSVEDELRELLE